MTAQSAHSIRTRWLAVIVLSAAQIMIILDQNIVNVALPAIRDDLVFSQANLVWAVNAYVIPFGGLLLLAGRLGDLIGRKRILLTGLGLFVVASALAALADSQELLLTARFAQGVGGAVTAAGLLGMIVTIFPEPEHRAKAIGVYGFASAGGGAAGSVVGGVLTEALGWESVFYINVPIGLTVAALAWKLLPSEHGVGMRAGADVLGAALATSGLMLAVYTLVAMESSGSDPARTIGPGAVAAVLLAAFALRQAKAAAPLIPPRLLRSRTVVGANLVQALTVGAAFGLMYFTVLYLQQVLGLTPLSAGLAFLPAPIAIATMSVVVAPRLLARFGALPLVLTGLPVMFTGFILFAQTRAGGSYTIDVLPGVLTVPLGFGLAMPALMSLGMSDSRPEDAGVTSGLFNTAQQAGGAVGLAVLSAAVASRADGLLDRGHSTAEALTGGYRVGYAIAAGFIALAFVLAVLTLKARARRQDEPELEHVA